jgi:hypothetical protein
MALTSGFGIPCLAPISNLENINKKWRNWLGKTKDSD